MVCWQYGVCAGKEQQEVGVADRYEEATSVVYPQNILLVQMEGG
jgi:hypothetical protein